MKKNNILTLVMILIISGFTVNTNAQFGKITKDLKNKAKKTIKKTTKPIKKATGVDVGKLSETCLRYVKSMKEREQKIYTRLKENNPASANLNLKAYQNYINKYKENGCPGVGKYEAKAKELEAKINQGSIQSDPYPHFKEGVAQNSTAIIDEALNNGLDIDGAYQIHERTVSKTCPLVHIITEGNIELLKYLVGKGADVNNTKNFAGDPLFQATRLGKTEMVKFLLEKGADPSLSKTSLLVTAADKDNLELVKLFNTHKTFKPSNEIYSKALNKLSENSKSLTYLKQVVKEYKESKVTDKTNKEFANRMVFSNQCIPSENANKSKFKTKINALDVNFVRLYFPCFYSELFFGNDDNSPHSLYDINIWATIEGSNEAYKIKGLDLLAKAPKPDSSSYLLILNPKEIDKNNTQKRVGYNKLIRALKTGENKVKFFAEIYRPSKGKPVKYFEEEITIVKKPGDYYVIGKKYSDFKAGMKNAQLEAQLLQVMKGGKRNIKKLKIASSDWKITRNSLTGVVTGRTISAYCYFIEPDGGCVVTQVSFAQEHDGSKFSGKIYYKSASWDTYVDCD
jgi:hypothetical protein